jgi:hypothetical protein
MQPMMNMMIAAMELNDDCDDAPKYDPCLEYLSLERCAILL